METSYADLQQRDPQPIVMGEVFQLEDCVRNLLDAADELRDNEFDDPRLVFDVFVDGRRYTISIVEAAELDDSQRRLTAREQDVVRLISKGFATKTIASVLGLKPCTVSTYTKRIYLKLNVSSRAEMVAKVLGDPSLFYYPARPSDATN